MAITIGQTSTVSAGATVLAPYVTWGVQYHFALDKAPDGWNVAIAAGIIIGAHAAYNLFRRWFPALPEQPPVISPADHQEAKPHA